MGQDIESLTAMRVLKFCRPNANSPTATDVRRERTVPAKVRLPTLRGAGSQRGKTLNGELHAECFLRGAQSCFRGADRGIGFLFVVGRF